MQSIRCVLCLAVGVVSRAPNLLHLNAQAVFGTTVSRVCSSLSLQASMRMQELVEDLHEECGKHGTVVDTRVPCPDRSTTDLEGIIGTGCYGKVYCLMDTIDSAVNIQQTFNGRIYDGRTLQVSFIQPAHFYMLPVPIPMQPDAFS